MSGTQSINHAVNCFTCLLLVLTLLITPGRSLSASPKTIPSKFRLNRHGQPRLCSVVGVALNGLTRAGLCFPSSFNELSVQVKADSNRAVLQGNIQDISIRVQDSKSKWLMVDQFQLRASNLQLGRAPSLILATMFLRPTLLLRCLLGWSLWRIYGNYVKNFLRTNSTTSSYYYKDFQPQWRKFRAKAKEFMGGVPISANYDLTLTDDNLKNSVLLQRFSRMVLESLMQNSVLQVAAAAGDTAMLLQDAQNNNNNKSGVLRNAKLEESSLALSKLKSGKLNPQSAFSAPESAEKSFKLTQLLSATSFELRETPTFSQDGRLLFPGRAVFPDGSAHLDFDLRTLIQARNTPSWMRDMNTNNNPLPQDGIAFDSPQCLFDMDAASGSIPGFLGKLLPSVLWIPVGPGVVLPLGPQHQVERVTINSGNCQLQGQLTLLGKKENEVKPPDQTSTIFSNFFPKPGSKKKMLPPAKQ